LINDFVTVRQGLDWFQKNFTDEYYTLLDWLSFDIPSITWYNGGTIFN
jgi:hypothetical protein